MKKTNLLIATLLVVAATVATVSCKKQTPEVMLSDSRPAKTFTVPQVDDMNAYLKDFKQRMQTSKGAEENTVAEAEWHLSSLANYDFANANVEYADIRFDTLYTHLSITKGMINMSDLNTAYSALSSAISDHMRDISLVNANIRFVDVAISGTGDVTAVLTITFDWGHTWYFEDVFDANMNCSLYFSNYSTYYSSGLGRIELQRVLNLIESHLTPVWSPRIYYTQSREVVFNYNENIDPYGSPFFLNSRLCASSTFLDPDISFEMCYLLDSYLGLGYDNILPTEVIGKWLVDYNTGYNYAYTPHQIGYHTLTVKYAIPHTIEPDEPGIND